MHVRRLVTACCHHKVARNAEICPATDACSSKIVQTTRSSFALWRTFSNAVRMVVIEHHGERLGLDARNRTPSLAKTKPLSGPKRDANVIVASA
jgi:hypothetical protein